MTSNQTTVTVMAGVTRAVGCFGTHYLAPAVDGPRFIVKLELRTEYGDFEVKLRVQDFTHAQYFTEVFSRYAMMARRLQATLQIIDVPGCDPDIRVMEISDRENPKLPAFTVAESFQIAKVQQQKFSVLDPDSVDADGNAVYSRNINKERDENESI